MEPQRLALDGLVCSLDGHLKALGLQCHEVRAERVEPALGDGHQHDAGELAGQP
jgi:hypothetical protein